MPFRVRVLSFCGQATPGPADRAHGPFLATAASPSAPSFGSAAASFGKAFGTHTSQARCRPPCALALLDLAERGCREAPSPKRGAAVAAAGARPLRHRLLPLRQPRRPIHIRSSCASLRLTLPAANMGIVDAMRRLSGEPPLQAAAACRRRSAAPAQQQHMLPRPRAACNYIR